MRIAIVALLVFVATGSAPVPKSKASGLEVPPGTKLWVFVEDLPDDAKKLGLSWYVIKAKVELQLRRNGIPVGNGEDLFKDGVLVYVKCAYRRGRTGPLMAKGACLTR